MFPKVPTIQTKNCILIGRYKTRTPSRLTIACGFSRIGAEVPLQWNPLKHFAFLLCRIMTNLLMRLGGLLQNPA